MRAVLTCLAVMGAVAVGCSGEDAKPPASKVVAADHPLRMHAPLR
jgi:hypothetical protein